MSLDEFRPLHPAEEVIVAGLKSGDFDPLGDGTRPTHPAASRLVRAEFLRFLLLGGEEGFRPHEKGVRIRGGCIVGTLDLEGCRIPRDIGLADCLFEQMPVLRSAIIDNLFLDGSSLPGLDADRLEARADVRLRDTVIKGVVRLRGARVGGIVNADHAEIDAPLQFALQADDLDARAVLLRGAKLAGGVKLAGARIGGDIDAHGIAIVTPGEAAFDAESAEVRGNIVLRHARIEGLVRIVSARVGNDLDATGAVLSNPEREALQMNGAAIAGGVFLIGGARVRGGCDLTGAVFGNLHDEMEAWPEPGDLRLNRCLYDSFIDGPADAKRRLAWLALQDPARWGEDFWPQPYEQLAKVFREMGHEEDARAVLIAKERLQRKARRDRARNPVLRLFLVIKDWVLGATLLYGRQPLLAFVWLIVFWGLGVAIFETAARNDAFKPNSAVVLRSVEWTMCAVPQGEQRFLISVRLEVAGRAAPGQTQLACFLSQWEASSYPALNTWMYSLETLFPVLEIDQKQFWRPDPATSIGNLALIYFYFQSLVGWALSLLAVAGFSGLVKSR